MENDFLLSNAVLPAAVSQPLQVLWDYLKLDHLPEQADCIVGFGNYNQDIPLRAAELYVQGYSRHVLFSGGLGRNTLGMQALPEADRFAATAIAAGLPDSVILRENRSTNTAENIRFTRALLEANGIQARTLLGVHQPFMERRIWAAFGVYWPEVRLVITSPQVDIPTFLDHAVTYGITRRAAIEEIVGDFQRMELYANKGWQLPQPIPAEAWEAYEELKQLGFTGQLA